MKNYLKRYSEREKNILYFHHDREKTDSMFWDNRWQKIDITKKLRNIKPKSHITKITSKFLNKGSIILEGGCGYGDKVLSLDMYGYDTYGIDSAKKTVNIVNELYPNLKISVGDVEKLNFIDDFFDGYWSLGVIEHDINGFDSVLDEMARVIKKNGYLFITFPYMNPLRMLKSKLKYYESYDNKKSHFFYQYIYNKQFVFNKIENKGFKLIETRPYDIWMGLIIGSQKTGQKLKVRK